MTTLKQVLEWNRDKWEKKNQTMYVGGPENQWAWYNDRLDEDVSELLTQPSGYAEILDLGTCSGSQAIGLAQMGYAVVGTDVSESALRQARTDKEKLGDVGLKLSFELDDIITTRFPDDRFDVIFDRGCYHSICYFSHDAYVLQTKRILRPNGLLLLKVMSAKEDRFAGFEQIDGTKFPMPYKFDAARLMKVFSSVFEILDIRESYFYSTRTNPPARAMFAILKNTK